jgi:hypothetical protein
VQNIATLPQDVLAEMTDAVLSCINGNPQKPANSAAG